MAADFTDQKWNANFNLLSSCPGMNSGSGSPPTARFSALGSCQAGDGIPSRTMSRCSFTRCYLLTTHIQALLPCSFLPRACAGERGTFCFLRTHLGKRARAILPRALPAAQRFSVLKPSAKGRPRRRTLLTQRTCARTSSYSNTQRRMAFCACIRFSAWSKITDCGPSATSSVISSPRWAGRQCMTSASGRAYASKAVLT